MKLRTGWCGSLVTVLMLGLEPAAAAAQTNGFVLQCLSARTSGQGCVTRAQEGTPTNLFRDPAGLVQFDRPALEVNFAPCAPSLTFQNEANPTVDGSRHVYPLGSVAFAGPRLGRFAWAVGIEPIGGFGSDFLLQHALLSGPDGDMVRYESFFGAMKIGGSVATELAPGFSVGAGLSAVYAQIRDFRMPFTMPPQFAPGMMAIVQLDPAVYGPAFQGVTEMTAYGDSERYSGLTWTADVGVRYQTASGFTVAASWSPETPIEVDGGSAMIDMTAQFGQMMQAMVMARVEAYGESPETAQDQVMQQLTSAGLDPSAGMTGDYSASTTITLPMTAGVGASIPAGDRLRFAAEVEWRRWSSAEGTMPFRLTEGTNPNINALVNGDPTNGDFTYPFPLDWSDTWSGKVGAELGLGSGNALRVGYLYGQNPVPDNTVFITFPAISTQAATVGLTWTLAGVPLDIGYAHAFDEELTGASHDHLLGSEYDGSRTTMSQNTLTLGVRIPF